MKRYPDLYSDEYLKVSLSELAAQQKQLPLVSVLVPAYNAECFIARTLQSILSQTYPYLEVLVVDDGSQDNTAAIVKQIAEQDQRVRLLVQANAGVAAARNLAICHANGEFVAPIDADDLWYPTHLARQVVCLLLAPSQVGLVYSWSIDIDEQDRQTAGFHAAQIQGNVYRTLLCHNFLGNASCTLIRRSVLLQAGLYCEEFQQQAYGCEDWDLYLRIAALYQFRVVPQFTVGYRKLPLSMSGNYHRMAQSHLLMLQRVQQTYPNLPTCLYRLSRSSLYLYFAQQCHANQNYHDTLSWLNQAMRADLSPWLRLGTYSLGLKSWLGLITQRRDRLNSAARTTSGAISGHPPSQLQIKFKLLVGNGLHTLLSGSATNLTGTAVREPDVSAN